MTWTFHQSGKLTGEGATYPAYSGHGAGLDNHAMEGVRGVGPLPVGKYKVGPWENFHPHLGPCVAPLIPQFKTARSGFFAHGDNPAMNHTASDGCVIADHTTRTAWRNSGDTDLEVVE